MRCAWGHSVTVLLDSLPATNRPTVDLLDAAKALDKHYVPARYPNSHPEGAPFDFYTEGEAQRAADRAGDIIRFCADLLAGSS